MTRRDGVDGTSQNEIYKITFLFYNLENPPLLLSRIARDSVNVIISRVLSNSVAVNGAD